MLNVEEEVKHCLKKATMNISEKLIACLLLLCLLGPTLAHGQTYKVSFENLKLKNSERILGFKLYFYDGVVRTFSNAPNDWKIVLNNWDEEDQLHWTGSLKGMSDHGGGLKIEDFLKIFVIMNVDPDSNLKLEVTAEDFNKYTKRTITLTKKQLAIKPVNDQTGKN
jgi:hypothetical protein